jgi:hypothetical protein
MAARRLLIVMLILLGLSTLAAALVPPRSLREGATTPSTTSTTQPVRTAPVAPPPSGRMLVAKLALGSNKMAGTVPRLIRACPVTAGPKGPCFAIRAGDQLSLVIRSPKATQLEIPGFGLVQTVAPDAPARFELLPDAPGIYGVLFAPTQKVAAQIRVLPQSGARTKKSPKKAARSGARAGSNPA